jgi:hypothetical protein
MRVGHNPLRLMPASYYKDVVFCVITHLPSLQEEYHSKRFEVVQTCLQSMTGNANMVHSLAVWDNGSCDEFRAWLRDEMKPDLLIESANIGKAPARSSMLRMFKPKTILCISDDDMYFYPDWLAPQLELLNHFPNVACVTGYPVRTAFRWGCENTKTWARRNATLESGRFIPQQWENDFAVSIGRDPDWHMQYSKADLDYRITYKGKQAYATSHHCQFIGRAETLTKITSWDGRAMGDERPFDVGLDAVGLRLATIERYTRHIGNVLHDELRNEIQAAELIPA